MTKTTATVAIAPVEPTFGSLEFFFFEFVSGFEFRYSKFIVQICNPHDDIGYCYKLLNCYIEINTIISPAT